MPPMKKLTVRLPVDLIARATQVSGAGPTRTIREALEALVTSNACKELRQLRGRLRLSIDPTDLRRD